MADIHDVIGSLRSNYLKLSKRIDELHLVVKLLEHRVDRFEKALAHNEILQSTLEDPDGNSIDSLVPPPSSEPKASPSVGAKRPRRNTDGAGVRGGSERRDDSGQRAE